MNIAAFLTDSRKMTYILGGFIALTVFIAIIFIISQSGGGGGGQPAELLVWGVFDDFAVFDDAITAFEKANADVNVTYEMIPFADYERRLLNAQAAGEGPDVFMMHNTWLPRYADKIQPLPNRFPDTNTALMTVRQYRDLFVDVAYADLVAGEDIYAMPLYVDTLALYYNRDMLSGAGVATPPRLWTDFQDAVKKITLYDQSRNITRSGVAMGTTGNINRSTDILMMLMLQSGVRMTDDERTEATFSRSVDNQPVGATALTFYTDFANPQKEVYTWNDSQDNNIDAFTSGKTAMIINYQHQAEMIREKAPRMDFGVAPVPQITSSDVRTYANYWAFTVSKGSPSPYAAWRLAHYLTAGEGAGFYIGLAGRPSARRDYIQQQQADPAIGVFAEQALNARSWYQVDNIALETIFADMIDAVNFGRSSVRDALEDAEAKVSVLMSSRR
ncbi:MAG TPA: extracellular solute-binding protein [Candidatus Paceibacterota bacterium]|nr:extracellular solute-binding protein [Candidatus Paceibacterota bacterium]